MIGRLFSIKSHPGFRGRMPTLPDGLRLYVIADIHGHSDLLDALHTKIARDLDASPPPAEARLIYLGDYIDRGPDSAGVLERLSTPPLRGLARTCLRGNHDDILAQLLATGTVDPGWRYYGGNETLLSYRVPAAATLAEGGWPRVAERLAQEMPPHHRAFLDGLGYATSHGDYFFCHAGVRPGVALDRQQPKDLMWIREQFNSSTADFGKIVVHGHTPVEDPEFWPNRINIDTGAYATGRLTCLVLEGETRRILSTK